MNPKSILQRDKELTKWWVSIAHDDRFESVCAFVLADYAVSAPTQDRLEGAKAIIERFGTILDNEPTSFDMPSPGLKHSIETVPEKEKETK